MRLPFDDLKIRLDKIGPWRVPSARLRKDSEMNRRASCLLITSWICITVALVAGSAAADERADRAAFDQLRKVWVSLAERGQYKEAGEVAEQMLVVCRRSVHEYIPFALAGVGDCLGRTGRHKEAMAYHSECLDLLSKTRPINDTVRAINIQLFGTELIDLGQCYRLEGNYREAAKFFEKAIKWGEQFDSKFLIANGTSSLAQAYYWLSEFEKAETTYRAAVALQEQLARAERSPGTATANLAKDYSNWGNLYRSLGRYDIAESMYRHALKLQVLVGGWEHPSTATKLHNLSVVSYENGQFRDAESYLRQALAIREKILGPDHPDTVDTIAGLGRVASAFGQHEQAEKLLRRAVAGYQALSAGTAPHAVALRHLADALQSQGKADEAESIVMQGLVLLERTVGPTHEQYVQTLLELAQLKARVSPQATKEITDRIEGIHAQVPLSPTLLSELYRIQATGCWFTDQKPQALELLGRSIEQVELQRNFSSGAERERADLFSTFSGRYELMVEWQAELGNVEAAFAAIEDLRARTYLEELQLKGNDPLEGVSAEERTRLRTRETQLRQELSAAETQLAGLPDPGPSPQPKVLAQRKQAMEAVLIARQKLYEHDAEIKKVSPLYKQLLSGGRQKITIADVQSSLIEGERSLLYQVGDDRSYLMVIGPKEAKIVPLSVDESTAKKLGIQAGLLTRGDLVKVLQDEKEGVLQSLSRPKGVSKTEQLAALWNVLVPETERATLLDGSVKRLLILPDGPLALLPFEALVVSQDVEPQYLLDVGPPIAYAPSAAVLMNLAKREAPAPVAGREPILTLGDPTYPQGNAAPDSIDRKLGMARSADQFRAGPARLPFTGWEAQWVQQMFDKIGLSSLKLTGPQATEAAIRREAPGRQIIHLACHGMADQNYGNFFGSLAVTPGKAGDPADDGFLSMSEIYGLNLTGCELAILSACETNYGPQQQGEGVWALSRGFLVAGARRVVASNWVVDDQAGATLVSFFASYLAAAGKDAASRDYAKALHEAKKQVRKESKWSDPFYWSSLVLVGPR
jgi:CHAT domain-containing protein/tetratricopeptide (TPR) repeat protein